jgi:hypothetical protein
LKNPHRSALIGRVVLGVERNEPQKLTLPEGQGTDSLAQAKRVYRGAVGGLKVFNRLPTEAGVPIQNVPIYPLKAAERCDNLLQFG